MEHCHIQITIHVDYEIKLKIYNNSSFEVNKFEYIVG